MKAAYSLPMKIAAVILSYVLVLAIVLGAVGIFFLVDNNAYSISSVNFKNNFVRRKIMPDVYDCLMALSETENYHNDNALLEFTITSDVTGTVIFSDYDGEPYADSVSVSFAQGDIGDIYIDRASEVDVSNESEIVMPEGNGYYVNGYEEDGCIYYNINRFVPYEDVTVTVYIVETTGVASNYALFSRILNTLYEMRVSIFIIEIVLLILYIVLMVYLCCVSGRREKNGEAKKNHIDRLPFDIHTAIVAICGFLCAALIAETVNYSDLFLVVMSAIALSAMYFIAINYIMSFATRIKTGGIIKSTLIYKIVAAIGKILKKLWRLVKFAFSAIPQVWQGVLILCAVAVYELIMISMYYSEYRFLMWVLEAVIVFTLVILSIFALKKIRSGAKELADGNIEYQISTKYMPGGLRGFADDMNSISKGLTAAVEERMKSERFKTELITNVSHDIKTPLTSIINYVDLIKKEKPENENIRQYIDVLDRQSSRLKKLIEDLVEASKASTGNISVNLEPCEVSVILAQAAGEYEEKLKTRNLDLILSLPEESYWIMADGRHLWRVLDNLLNNIFKYAQPGTRVYINLERSGGKIAIVFKNISNYALNISSDELLERFTRGDSSRNTEGSGLGLSIANSLTELQGGQLSLTVDGDLFKVRLIFDEM